MSDSKQNPREREMAGRTKGRMLRSVKSLTVEELAAALGCAFEGDGRVEVRGVSSLEKAREGDLVFLAQRKYRKLLDESRASAAVVPVDEKYGRIPVIRAENPHLAFVRAVELFWAPYRPEPGIHPAAVVAASARLGKDVSVGAFAYVGDGAEVGEKTVIFPFAAIYPGVKIGGGCVIHSHVSVREDVRVGNRVIIHNGAVIGADGFGYVQNKERRNIKIPQAGTVVIEDDVEIGANTCVDRAALGETVIGKGTKIDNLVQVGHNVDIGEGCIVAGQTGISGSVKVGKHVIMGGQVAVADHVTVGDGVMMAGRTGVTGDVPAGAVVAGVPHQDIKVWRKSSLLFPRLYELFKEVKALKKKVASLEKKLK